MQISVSTSGDIADTHIIGTRNKHRHFNNCIKYTETNSKMNSPIQRELNSIDRRLHVLKDNEQQLLDDIRILEYDLSNIVNLPDTSVARSIATQTASINHRIISLNTILHTYNIEIPLVEPCDLLVKCQARDAIRDKINKKHNKIRQITLHRNELLLRQKIRIVNL